MQTDRHTTKFQAPQTSEQTLVELGRLVSAVVRKAGAYSVAPCWADVVEDIAFELAGSMRAGNHEAGELDSTIKNLLWARVLDLMQHNDRRAFEFFAASVRRLVARLDGGRRHEDSWDDIVQTSAIQMLEAWSSGRAERPWAMLCTIARRRYYDLCRATRPTDELTEELVAGDADGLETAAELLPAKARALLSELEWRIVARMDLSGETRVEIAKALGMTEGEVVSARRAGLRKLYRMLGATLPSDLRPVWNEMFKGARRATPETAAGSLGLSVEQVRGSLAQARALLCLG